MSKLKTMLKGTMERLNNVQKVIQLSRKKLTNESKQPENLMKKQRVSLINNALNGLMRVPV